MAVISTPNASSIKVKFDQGTNLDGDRIIATKTYSSVKSAASNEDIMAIAVSKNKPEALEAINEGLKVLKENGKLEELKAKYNFYF